MTESPQVAAIKARYQGSLIEKSEMFAAHVRALSASKGEAEQKVRQELREDLHKLAGSSGMYGYNDLSQLSREAMKTIDEDQPEALNKCMSELLDLLKQHA